MARADTSVERFRIASRLALVLLGLQLFPAGAAAQAEAEQRLQIQQMSAEQKNALLRKKKRFDALTERQQQRMRSLHRQIANDPRADRLRITMVRYTQWLKTLTPEQRATLQGLSPAERIGRIEELRRREKRLAPRGTGDPRLPLQDLRAVQDWLDRFLLQHREQVLAQMPQRMQKQVPKLTDRQRRRALRRAYLIGLNQGKVPRPGRSELDQLRQRLSHRGRLALQEAVRTDTTQSRKRVISWIVQSVLGRSLINQDQIKQFFRDELSDQQRRRLDQLPLGERNAELRRLFFERLRQGRGRNGF